MMTALAIGLHNFPEGLATFVGTLDDPTVGMGLAIAIGIHNVPEGLCVSVPIYYATKNRWQAFKWAFISGISEPIGAGLGWLFLANNMSATTFATIFGIVSGMMVNICVHELLPTAAKYDPTDRVTSKCVIAGMFVMALSLVLFQV
jgi:ZIP family zinc transporter